MSIDGRGTADEARRKKILTLADGMLNDIASTRSAIAQLAGEYQKKVDRIKRLYEGEVAEGKASLAEQEKRVRAFMKKHQADLFEGPDSRLELGAGSMLWTRQERAKQIKGMLAVLENKGLDDLIKTAKSVNWDAIDKLDDAQLELLGTERVKKDVFAYELKEVGDAAARH